MKKISNTEQSIKKNQSISSIQKVRRDKAKNALIETKVSLEIASREISKFIDEFQIAKSDEEKASVINQCIRYLAQNCMSNLQLSQLANSQSELTNFRQLKLNNM